MRDDGSTRGRGFALSVALLTLGALALRTAGLPGEVLLADDALVGASAINFLERAHIGPTMWHHPRLRDLLVYASISLFGINKLSLTCFSVAFGTLSVPLIAVVTRRLLGSAPVALGAAALLAVDPLHVDFSRQAVHENYMPFFVLAGIWLALRYDERSRVGALVGAGVAFGLGIASKWSVAFPAVVVLAWLVWRAARAPGEGRALRAAHVTAVLAALVVLPLVVYVASHGPWFLGGNGLADFVHLNREMLRENLSHQGGNPSQLLLTHRAALWFVRPIEWADFAVSPSGHVILIAITNPVVWLLGVPALALLVREGLRVRRGREILLAALFFASYLPFVASPRPIFASSALNVLPFVLPAIAHLVLRAAALFARPRRVLAAYAAVVAVTSAPLYLLAIGKGTDLPVLHELVMSMRPPPELER